MKFIGALILTCIPLITLGYTTLNRLGWLSSPEVHYHAGFLIVEKGEALDFSGLEYQTIQPCTNTKNTQPSLHHSNIHLHDGIGDVAHIHTDGQTWRDLLEALDVSIETYTQVYLNGVEITGIDTIIQPYDRILFADRSTQITPSMIADIPSIDTIKEVEKKSETCK
jgi:hypothetical protein